MADDWKSKAMRYGLIGGGIGTAGALVLRALHDLTNKRKPVKQLVPKTIVEQPYYVDEDEAERLRQQGIKVKKPRRGFGKTAGLRRELYNAGKCFGDIVEAKTHLKFAGSKEGGVAEWLGEGITDIAVPALAGLGGGYLGFKGVDWLFDKMNKDEAKSRYEKRRRELKKLMDQMNTGLGKVASDRMHGGNLGEHMAYFVNHIDEISKLAGEVMRSKGITKEAWFSDTGEKMLEPFKSGVKGYGGLMIGLPLALAAISAAPAALRAFKKRNPNTGTLRNIEEHYRELPDQPRVKLVPTLRRPPRRKSQDEDDEGNEPIPGPGYRKAAAPTNPSLAGQPVHSSIHPPTIDTSPNKPRAELSKRPGVPMSLGEPATGSPAANAAMPSPNQQTSTSPNLGGPIRPPQFSGMFANTGFTRRNAGNMPVMKNPGANTPRAMAGIGNALS